MLDTCKLWSVAAGVLAVALALVGAAGGADRKPIPPTATFVTQEEIAAQHLEFSFGAPPAGPCGYVPNVVPPQISGDTTVGGTLTTWPGQWNPCSPPLVAVDVYWPSDGSHGTTHVVTAGDQAAGVVCSQSTVWDSADDVGGPMTACVSIPQAPPPPTCVIYETQAPWISGATSPGAALTMNGGAWQPSCGGGLSAADIRWWPDGSHSATYVVKSSDLGTSVCATVTVWDYNGASGSDAACMAIPAGPPPPPPPPPPPADTTPPTVALTGPTAGSYLFDPVDVTANAADNVAVAGVQFKVDGSNVGGEDTSAPYSVTWDIAATGVGTHTLTAVARDAAGNTTTSTGVTVTVSDGVTDGEGVEQTSPALRLPLTTACATAAASAGSADTAAGTCVANAACTGAKRAIGTAAAPGPGDQPITYRNRITKLVYWKASAAIDVCVDTGHHEILGFSGGRVVPLYTFPLVWSYDNSPHWSYGPAGKGVKSSWVQVTDSFSGCPFKLRFGCNTVTFIVRWAIQGSGTYTWAVKFV